MSRVSIVYNSVSSANKYTKKAYINYYTFQNEMYNSAIEMRSDPVVKSFINTYNGKGLRLFLTEKKSKFPDISLLAGNYLSPRVQNAAQRRG
jgi:hypothetical protein